MDVIEQNVNLTVEAFVANGESFTALDVSNAVKGAGVFCRHAEVRDYVRRYFRSGGMVGYTRTPIGVTLPNGASESAMLYHSDQLTPDELDDVYPAAKRNQSAQPTPSGLVAAAKMLMKPKQLGAYLANKAKSFVAPTSDGDDGTGT